MDKHVTMDINEYTNDYDNVRNKCKDKEQHTIVHFGREKKEGRTDKFSFKDGLRKATEVYMHLKENLAKKNKLNYNYFHPQNAYCENILLKTKDRL